VRGSVLLPGQQQLNPEMVVWTGGSRRLAMILQGRGITSREEVEQILNPLARPQPDLSGYRPLAAAIERIEAALAQGEKIAVYGDYDVDGITATALLVTALGRLGADVIWHIPNRFSEGYGLEARRVQALAREGVGLVVTCDCGISNHAEVELANALGMDVVITDHHTPPPELPPAHSIVNFKLLPPDHPSRDLPGVGVAYVLAKQLLARHGKEDDDLLDLVALGIIADVVPLRGHNRQLYALGLPLLQEARRPGLAALFAVAGINPELVDEDKLAYQIAPRINAAGRLGDGSTAVRLLLSREQEETAALARELDQLNSLRKEMSKKILDEVSPEPGRALVAYNPDWHQGVIGIAAGQICSGNGTPAVLMTRAHQEDSIVGSARSVEGIDIYEILHQCSRFLDKFGGHPAAAGFSLRPQNLEPFVRAVQELLDAITARWTPPPLRADLVVQPWEIDLQLAEELNRLSPCGEGNPRPLLFCQDLAVKSVRAAGTGHILTLGDRWRSFAAGLWNSGAAPQPGGSVGAVFTVSRDMYRGEPSVWATLEAWWPGEARVEIGGKKREYRDARGVSWKRLLRQYPEAEFYREGVQWQDFPGNMRFNLQPAPVLVMLSPPPSAGVLRQILATVDPDLVVLGFAWQQRDFMADFLGALKYLWSQGTGEVALGGLAAALGHNEDTILAALRLLAVSGIVDFTLTRGKLTVEKGRGAKIKAGPEKQKLLAMLQETVSFQKWLQQADIDEIQLIRP